MDKVNTKIEKLLQLSKAAKDKSQNIQVKPIFDIESSIYDSKAALG